MFLLQPKILVLEVIYFRLHKNTRKQKFGMWFFVEIIHRKNTHVWLEGSNLKTFIFSFKKTKPSTGRRGLRFISIILKTTKKVKN